MFNFIHRLTCKHREVHRLRPPESLEALSNLHILSQHGRVRLLRSWRLSVEVYRELRNLSAPTPGPKDETTG